jgi:hypothetical protein
MTLQERLTADSRQAMRDRAEGKLRLSVLRLAIAAVRNAEIASGRPLDDAGVLDVLTREARQRRDALRQIEGRGRPEAEAQLHAELEVLAAYLPAAMDPAELEAAARAAVAEVGATSPRELGRVMGVLMPRLAGRADGAAAQAAVRRVLGG